MPELPEVENLARGLRAEILGERIESVCCHFPPVLGTDPKSFSRYVLGKAIEDICRHGKYLFLRLSGSLHLALHLRMTGQLLLLPRNAVVDKHTHLEIYLKDRSRKIAFRDVRKFGRLLLLETGIEKFLIQKKLGPDALDITGRRLTEAFRKTKRSIKSALLDQTVIAGLGNIYTDEILFREAIAPQRPVSTLAPKEIASLLRTTRKVLRLAIRGCGTSISDYVGVEGQQGSYQHKLRVYNRQGRPCTRCGTPIDKAKVAGRGTYFCPACQSS
jgi:formamidopyrimidine-DNA glycosylase